MNPEVKEAIQASLPTDPFAGEDRRGDYYVYEINGVAQLLNARDVYHLRERERNGMIMTVKYLGRTDGAAFREQQDTTQITGIEVKIKDIVSKLSTYPNVDIIPKDSPLKAEIDALWQSYYDLNGELSRLRNDMRASDPQEALAKEVKKAQEWLADTLEVAKKDRWSQDRLEAELYPDSTVYEVYTPRGERDKILETGSYRRR